MNVPPKWLSWLLDKCSPEDRPDLKGDFLELYDKLSTNTSRSNANRKLLKDTLSILPLNFIIKRERHYPSPTMVKTYIKIARRTLFKNKVYTAINIAGLAISLAICILITLFIRDELGFDKSFEGSDKVYRIAGNYMQGGPDRIMSAATSYLVKPLIENDIDGLEAITRVDRTGDIMMVDDKQYVQSNIVFADSTFFDVFKADFLSGDRSTSLDQPGNVVVDKPTALKFFGTTDVLGRFVELKDKQFVITGVFEPFPENTHFKCQIVFPISGIKQWYPDWVLTNASGTSLYTYVRVKENFDVQGFQAAATKQVKSGWGWENDSAPKYFLQPLTSIHLYSNLHEEAGENGSITTLYIFATTAVIIFILACINYINLTVVASFQRSKEVGVKKVLGSTTGMQLSQFQFESFFVATIALILAAVLAKLAMPLFNQLSGKLLDFNPFTDPWVGPGLLFVLLLIGVIGGAAPALVLLRTSTTGMLRNKLELRGRKSLVRSGLIVFQFSISITLILCTLIVIDQVHYIRNTDLGIDPESVVLIPLQTFDIAEKYDVMKTEMLNNPDVIAVAASSNKVTERIGGWRGYRPDPSKEDEVSCPSVAISTDFFETMKASVVEGRTFSKEHSTDVTTGYILNEAAVKMFNIDRPTGKNLFGATFNGSEWFRRNGEIIGVVKDFHFASLRDKVQPVVFYMASEKTESLAWVEVRIRSSQMSETIASLKANWKQVAGDRPFEFEFMDQAVALHYQAEDRFLKIFTAFSVLSIMLGGLGLFGLTAFMAKRRTKEIGIRRVLGATIYTLIGTLSADFLKLVAIANLIGWPIAYYFMRDWLGNFAYKTSISWWAFASTGVAVLLIAFLCVLYHSLKVSRINPVNSLRSE